MIEQLGVGPHHLMSFRHIPHEKMAMRQFATYAASALRVQRTQTPMTATLVLRAAPRFFSNGAPAALRTRV
jgi:hypothetical protein